MRLWRLSKYAQLDGIGGMKVSGRWHSAPRAVAYAAEHPALAVLEVLAHLHLSVHEMPATLRLVCLELPDTMSLAASAPADLPDGWQARLGTTRTLGNAWFDTAGSALLRVPSALVPHAANYLINVGRARAEGEIRVSSTSFWFDDRLARK